MPTLSQRPAATEHAPYYAKYVQLVPNGDLLSLLRDQLQDTVSLLANVSAEKADYAYAPGKWTARQILIHLAQTELALGNRARMALTTPNYIAQAFDQDRWVEIESGRSGGSGGREALDALIAVNAMNRAFFSSLSAPARETPFSHPEYGSLTVDWIIHQMAGHLRHHLQHCETIATR